ncbi:MAG: transcription antitermination factor NusB [Saprospiraceae bacterium]
MQVLYAMNRDEQLDYQRALQSYQTKIRSSFELYLLALRYLIHITRYARQDSQKKKAKLRPTEEDRTFKAHLVDQSVMASLIENEGLQKLFRLYKIEDKIDSDTVRLVYQDFAKKEAYKTYVSQTEVSDEQQVSIMLSLLKTCFNNEVFVEALEDHYPNYIDDKSLIVGAIKKNLKALPLADDFYEQYRPNRETTVDFGEALIRKVYEEEESLMTIIEPVLKNWDADRVAVIDLILLKMALSELLDFPSIPTKVTLNEFVEISKLYSTDKSKDFINGILDRLMKQLLDEGRINKKGRGLIG